jgi:hypothetical protein
VALPSRWQDVSRTPSIASTAVRNLNDAFVDGGRRRRTAIAVLAVLGEDEVGG